MRTKLIEITCDNCLDTQIFEDGERVSFEIRNAEWKRVDGQDVCKKCVEKMKVKKRRVA